MLWFPIKHNLYKDKKGSRNRLPFFCLIILVHIFSPKSSFVKKNTLIPPSTLLTLFFFISNCPVGKSQTWLNENHIWQYDLVNAWTTDPNGLYDLRIEKDTIVNGIDCKILSTTSSYPFAMYYITRTIAYEEGEALYTYSYYEEEFIKIYDFALEVGDTIKIGSIYNYEIIETGSMEINFKNRRFQINKEIISGLEFMVLEGIGTVGSPQINNPSFCSYLFIDQEFCSQAWDGFDLRFRCFQDEESIFSPYFDCSLSNSKYSLKSELSIFPNPTSGLISINGDNLNSIKNIQIFNQNGQLLFTKENVPKTINIKEFPEGLYLFKLNHKNGDSYTEKIIISN